MLIFFLDLQLKKKLDSELVIELGARATGSKLAESWPPNLSFSIVGKKKDVLS